MKRLLIIDGHAILHRAFHAIPPNFKANGGTPTNAIYGFVSMFLRVMETVKPDYVVVAFDLPQPNFRQQIYTQYQKKRPEMAGNLSEQIPLVFELLDRLKIKHFEVGGYEADDVIGTISRLATENEEVETIIVSGDRDLLQLVNEKVKVMVPLKGLSETKTYGIEQVKNEFGVLPSQWIDVKALKGDGSDNYPGVRGIGPKTALDLIAKYETLEELYRRIDEIDKKVAIKLATYVEDAGMAKKLATIVCDVPLVKLDLNELVVSEIDWENGVRFMRGELGFRSLVEKIEKDYMKIELKLTKKEKIKKDNEDQMGLF